MKYASLTTLLLVFFANTAMSAQPRPLLKSTVSLPLIFFACDAVAEDFSIPSNRLAPRVHLKLDPDWRFFLGEPSGASEEKFNDSQWRQIDLPHDWSIEDLPAASEPTAPTISVVAGTWRFKPGDDLNWKSPSLDDSEWQQVTLPSHWSDYKHNAENSFAWFRRRIDVPEAMRGKEIILLLGKIDDVDETYLNGVKIGGLGSLPPNYVTAWETERRYRVPSNLLKCDGTDLLSVRDYNGQADAGIYAIGTSSIHSGPFTSESISGTAQGYTQGGVGWYRKSFSLPESLKGRQVLLTFDGVYMNADVWFNGRRLGNHPYGYTSFSYDLTPHIRFAGQKNILAVKVDTSGKTSRWYSGSGIYRHVWLTITDPLHIAPAGVYATTPQVNTEEANVRIRTTLQNSRGTEVSVTLTTRLRDAQGSEVAIGSVSREIHAGEQSVFDQQLVLAKPSLWSPDMPTLYRIESTIDTGGQVLDEVHTPLGIRSISVDPQQGLLLNGQPLKLRGGCVHHDNGCLGSCAYDRAEERRVELLKGAGYNAIRTSHNPPSPAFLDACDRIGMLVMDEAFDCWRSGKNPQDYSLFFNEWWQRDLDSMVLRDRHHPSVAIWSIGNEIPGQNSAEGGEIASMLAARVRELDPSRPVAQAAHPDETKNLQCFKYLDICGYNYMPQNYAPDHAAHPNRVVCGTESFPMAMFDAWMAAIDHPFVIGDFVWTAFDYLGEAGLGKAVPQSFPPGYSDDRLWTVSNCGDFDLCGFKRAPSYYRDAVWGSGGKVSCFVEALGPDGKPAQVGAWNWGWIDERPSWTWPGLENKPLTVRVYSSAPQVRLTLNGNNLGIKPTVRSTRFTAKWEVPYNPGELIATALDLEGKEVGRWILRTAGKPASLRLSADRNVIRADGQDLSYVTVDLLDAQGVVDPTADREIRFSLTGPGKIIGVGNGDPRSVESFQQPHRRAYHGRCQVVVKADRQAGELRLKAEASDLQSAEITITTHAQP